MRLTGKVALITGASRGIGRAIAEKLSYAEAMVIGTATTERGVEVIGQYLGKSGIGCRMDVTDSRSVDDVLGSIKSKFGGIDILVNNAGITRDNLLMRMKEEEWMSVIETNLIAVYRLTRILIGSMIKKRYGRIINVGSVVGSTGNMGQTNYAAAKAGLVGFSKSLAQEVASRGITVNVVAPGFIETDMTSKLNSAQRDAILAKIPASRLGHPADIANAVHFLASSGASYITGETLHVNGGIYMA